MKTDLSQLCREFFYKFDTEEDHYWMANLSKSDMVEKYFGAKPIIVPISDELLGEPEYCHVNVKRTIELFGGTQQTGYRIYDTGYELNCEFHSNWIKPSGEMVDITPLNKICANKNKLSGQTCFVPCDRLTDSPVFRYEDGTVSVKPYIILYDLPLATKTLRRSKAAKKLKKIGFDDWSMLAVNGVAVVI